jgi:hypothetical protein
MILSHVQPLLPVQFRTRTYTSGVTHVLSHYYRRLHKDHKVLKVPAERRLVQRP